MWPLLSGIKCESFFFYTALKTVIDQNKPIPQKTNKRLAFNTGLHLFLNVFKIISNAAVTALFRLRCFIQSQAVTENDADFVAAVVLGG